MSPIEHYFENLLTMGSDIKGEPNKNALSKEVQEAVEICADYVKYDLLWGDTKANMAVMLTELKTEIDTMSDSVVEGRTVTITSWKGMQKRICKLIQSKIDKLKGNENG